MEDNFEWIWHGRRREPSKPLNPPNSCVSDLPPSLDDDEDEFNTNHGEASRGLLNSTHGPSYSARYLEPVGRIWPQVKSIVIESAPTLLMTTISLLFTGKLLDQVSRWRAMREVDQLIMIIPVVLNLKGNLEMNLSARLGTAANIGELDDPAVRRSMIIGNLSLLQVQAISVSFIASCTALLLGRFVPQNTLMPVKGSPAIKNSTATVRDIHDYTTTIDFRHAISLPSPGTIRKSGFPRLIMVASTAMSAACLSGLILGSFMCTLIVLCRKFNRDPDNIAPPVASCLGDLVTLILIGVLSNLLIPFLHTPIPFILGLLVIGVGIACFAFTLRNAHVRPLLTQGWTPLFGAMVISSGTGIVLDMFVSRYEGFAILAVVISGLPGAAGSIFVSRLSTALHAAAVALSHHPSAVRKDHHEPSPRLVMLTLLLITLPVEIIFLGILDGLEWLNLPILFVAFAIVFFCCAVIVSLVVARFLTDFLWSKNRDPDIYALPIHSAFMDLVGQLLLVLCFEIVSCLGTKVRLRI